MTRFVHVFPARMDALARLTGLVGEVGAAAGFERHDSLRLALVVEELFTNTVAHGFGGDSEAPVKIEFGVERGHVAVTYEDTGPPFDPFGAAGAAEPMQSAALVPGGLGLALIAGLASDLGYERAQGRNRISLILRATR